MRGNSNKMASAMCQNQFLGSRISLVSKSDIRYEGILYALDLNEATISLAKVRSFGTEDRPTERPVPPREDIFEYIVFRGSDIKIIDVVEPPKHASNTGMTGLPADPAIVDFSHPNNGGGHFAGPYDGGRRQNNSVLNTLFKGDRGGGGAPPMYMNRGSPQRRGGGGGGGGYDNRMMNGWNNNRNMGGGGGRQNYGQQGGRMNYGGNFRQGFIPHGQFQQRGRMTSPNRGGNYGQPQRRGGRQQGGGGGGRYQNRNRGMNTAAFPPKVSFDADFDFEEANKQLIASLEKTKLDDEGNSDGKTEDGDASKEDSDKEPKEPQVFYKKDNFFDSISCESLERSKGNVPRVDWKAERKLNAETFGLSQQQNNGGNQRNRRGGGQRMPRGISRQPSWMSPNKNFYGNNQRRGRIVMQ